MFGKYVNAIDAAGSNEAMIVMTTTGGYRI